MVTDMPSISEFTPVLCVYVLQVDIRIIELPEQL